MCEEKMQIAGDKMKVFILSLISDAKESGSELTGASELVNDWDNATGSNWMNDLVGEALENKLGEI